MTAVDVELLHDVTYLDDQGNRVSEQHIFDTVFAMIAEADRFVLLDMFLFNDFQGKKREELRLLSSQLTHSLQEKRRQSPSVPIIVITDPINLVYGGAESPQIEALKKSGVTVIVTNLDKLRDSNPLWTSFWRIFLQWFGNAKGGMLPNPFASDSELGVSLRSYLTLLNFKANHRKVLVTVSEDSASGLVMSANPHDGSSAHSNSAVKFSGAAAGLLLQSEMAVAKMSGYQIDAPKLPSVDAKESGVRLSIVTELGIKQALLETINGATAHDRLDIDVFYLADRDIVNALAKAAESGVKVRLLLDPNRDAFGHRKNGIPNRPVARELVEHGVEVRWCDTHGEQCHSKNLLRVSAEECVLIVGSANYTRRNLANYNLETSVMLKGKCDIEPFFGAQQMFESKWQNIGISFSVDYEQFAEKSILKYWLYRFQEWSGLSTF